MSSRRGYGNGVTHAELSTKIDSVGKRKERKEKQATRRCNLDFEYATRTGRQALARSPLPPPRRIRSRDPFRLFWPAFDLFPFFFRPLPVRTRFAVSSSEIGLGLDSSPSWRFSQNSLPILLPFPWNRASISNQTTAVTRNFTARRFASSIPLDSQ